MHRRPAPQASAGHRTRPSVLRGTWRAADLFRGFTSAEITADRREVESLRDFFWFDLCAEWDARHLHEHLKARLDSFSPEFRAMESAWADDEANHARGFLDLWCALYDEEESDVVERLSERRADFTAIERFLDDEFGITLLVAYDELATTRAYSLDVALYRRLGSERLERWIRLLIRDESYHHRNAMVLLRLLHGARIPGARRRIEEFVRYDLGDHGYRATFLFDHEWGHVDHRFYRRNGEILLSRLLASHSGSSTPSHRMAKVPSSRSTSSHGRLSR